MDLNNSGNILLKKDLQIADINVNTWYDEAQHRTRWLEAYNKGADNYVPITTETLAVGTKGS